MRVFEIDDFYAEERGDDGRRESRTFPQFEIIFPTMMNRDGVFYSLVSFHSPFPKKKKKLNLEKVELIMKNVVKSVLI